MKKFSIIAAFIFAVMISSTAMATTWTEIEVGDQITKLYVDKSSIKRGVQCAALNVNRADGFSANIKIEFFISDKETFAMINSMGFFEDNGLKKKCYINKIDEDGNIVQDDSFKPEVSNADGSDGNIWPKVYEYIQKNLP
ncbi:MAG: hypothetical protein IJQ85_06510 [Selenomonadaceae bacterium]|nr:hypothetical protein [Selenomonadaceae bacterium]